MLFRSVEVVAAVGEGELEPVLLAEAEQDVEQRAAGRLVRSSDKKGSGRRAPPSTSEVQAQARRRGPGPGRLSCRGSGGHPSSTQSASSHQCTALAEEAGLSWQQPQSQVQDPTQPTKLLLLQG